MTLYSFPEEVWEHVFSFVKSDRDRNAVSLVCKSWYEIERWSRRRVFVGNCYAVSPSIMIRRFPKVSSVEFKGKPHFADFNLVPDGWGGYVFPWVEEMARSYPWLEEIRLKRMVVTDEALDLIASSFKSFKIFVLHSCEGFSSFGLASLAASCRKLEVLELQECDVEDFGGGWISKFPNNCTSLVTLNISCLSSQWKPPNLDLLERLVARSPNLKSLLLNRTVSIERLATIILRAPHLVELGTGAFPDEVQSHIFSGLEKAFSGCKELKALSGFWDVVPMFLPVVYSICSQLTSLNLSSARIQSSDLGKLVGQCCNLNRLWVLDYIEDSGLETIAECCKSLQELRVFPSEPYLREPNVSLTERGLISVSEGCPKLQSVLYFCRQMTNAALVTISNNRPNLTHFRLCILQPQTPDYLTREPLDEGFGSIVKNCKSLRRLSLSGLLTDCVFMHIGAHAKKLEMLSVAFAGDSDLGLHYLLSGCESMRKLEIRDCPFGDKALLSNAGKLETMRSLWMSSCPVSFATCKLLSQKMPRLNVEVMDERGPPTSRPETCHVEKLYVYRTVAGPRSDMLESVWSMNCHYKDEQLTSKLS